MNQSFHGVWFTEQASVAGTTYHMAVGIRFDGELDRHALGEACAAVIARHPALSSAVAVDRDLPRLVPAAEKVTLTDAPFSEARLREEIARRYDLGRGPLARFTLLRESDTRHLLLVTAHHLVFDGTSKEILVNDLAAAYGGAALEPLAEAAPSPSDVESAKAYWAGRWAAPGEVVLPELVRTPVAAEPGATVELTLPGVAVDGLTRFEVVLGAVHVLLARYGNTGLPVTIGLSTRSEQTTDHIGLHVTELPVTVAAATGGFRDYALGLRSRLRELYRHRAVPLAQVVGGLRVAPALTPISVGYRRRGPAPAFPGVTASVEWSLFGGGARNALHLQIVDGDDGLAVSLQHSPDAIPTAAVARIGEHLRTVLAAVADDHDVDVATMPIMPPAELDTVLRRWNDTAREQRGTVPELFAAQVRHRPHDVAVVDGDHRLTYAELDAASAELAARLPGPGALIAVRLPRGWKAVVAMLAVMRSGGAYVPVDPAYPPARQELILADARPALVIDGLGALPEPQPVTEGIGEAAYVMYTSGSTGRPKGVVVPHGALANLLLGMAETLGSGPDDRWLGLTSLSFDISGLELFLPLVTGGRLVIAGSTGALDGRALTALIGREGVTHVQATPSGWQVLLDAGFDGRATITALAGGEVLPLDLARQVRARVARLHNVYGPTETTIWSTTDELPAEPSAVTIGRPIANTQAYVVDADGRPLPIGVWGELRIGGHGVASGYLRRPDLTEERFQDNPFAAGRLYRTGDRCRWAADGRIVYGGRTDGQVKVRGHRVELEEIETRLREHPGVAQAAVALRGGELAAYVVARGTAPDGAELRRHLAETLPAAMVPTRWSTLAQLPVSPNGKLDRAALPEPAPSRAPAAETGAAGEADELVAVLRGIWQEVLAIDDIGVDEDLFDLGGHSLTITRINVRIMQQLGREVPLEVFFDTPTIAEIAHHLREHGLPEHGLRERA
ncbi:amino acid adenylation domain-containing protein [Allocatelliglobosispora scoriae]|uniref:Amino acid adenylation domain-containing protein n=1 Tax=Allocatelliglobosispora scoriae TaxID=643052 RepID=A0A841BWR9_9ACTN|nr:non-ribosomal peptide synthetase [Allocatelliglobosispora scoriae]MBB5873567.1 amino acid adenylation domain-containing protein [Allocatelliglobosispora scoriae]